jgi:hypothetical protein
MSTQATSRFKIDAWEEHPHLETEDGSKLTRAHVKQTFHGDIHGHGEVEWLMCYRPGKTADFVGLQHLVGQVGERSGTRELEGIPGEGELRAPLGGQPSLTLTYRFDSPPTHNARHQAHI